jgi:outer membrane immunogenic protein
MTTRMLAAAALAALAAAATPTAAADLAGPSVIRAPETVVTFSGFYAGLSLGWIRPDGGTSTVGNDPLTRAGVAAGIVPGTGRGTNSGVVFGAHVGYNARFGSFVVGVEADHSGTSVEGGRARAGAVVPGGTVLPVLGAAPASIQFFQESNYRMVSLSTLRARMGYVVADRTLLYVTGGLAAANVGMDTRLVARAVDSGAALASWQRSGRDTVYGWTIGVGAEHAVTNQVTVRVEYLYYSLETSAVGTPLGFAATPALGAQLIGTSIAQRYTNDGHIVRLGASMRF